MDRKRIEKEAKEILDKFSKELDKAKIKEEDFNVLREEFEREEGAKGCEGFKEKLLGNASNKDKDFIIAEKRRFK